MIAVRKTLVALARRIVRQVWEVTAVLDLFLRAAREKGKAFLWAGAYGAVRWGVSRRSADRLIFWLEELGHLEVIDRGDRHSPRRIKMHLIPRDDVDLDEIRKSRLEICRRWDPVLACAHRILEAAPPLNSFCPIALSDDPDPCWSGRLTADPMVAFGHSRGSTSDEHRLFAAEDAAVSPTARSTPTGRHLRLIATPTHDTHTAEVIR